MDNAILRKRSSTFKTEGGSVTRVSDELLIDILRAWESWGGTAREFHESLGLSKGQLGGLMNKAKKLCREGNIVLGDFKEIKLDSIIGSGSPCGIEMSWEQGRVIYYRMPKLAMLLIQSRVDGSYLRLLKRIAKTQILIIDDFGVGKLSQDHVTDLLELVEDRYDVGSTIITAQLPPDEWHDYLGGGVVADGILDRILHNAHKFDLQADESVRKSRKGLSTVEKSEK